MKIEKKDLIKYSIIGILIMLVFIFGIFFLSRNKEEEKINLNKTSDNYDIDDSLIMNLYDRYNPERELMFNLVGSNISKDYYGYFYRKEKTRYKDLDDVIKNTILFNDADYKSWDYDEENHCHKLDNSDFKVIFDKLFGKDDYNLKFDDNYEVGLYVDDSSVCINDEGHGGDYDKVIDTYMVNAINEDDYISIYERVAFVKIGKEYLSFYKDYKMKDLVYKLKITDKLDMGFVNNEEVVSNVLLKYQDEFDLYEYKYKKGVDSYYFESIER